MMAYVLAIIPPLALVPLALVPLALVADPLAGIMVGGSAGFIAVLLGAAALGSLLNGLRERGAGNRGRFRAHAYTAADRDLPKAA
jgi:hypothetical protein